MISRIIKEITPITTEDFNLCNLTRRVIPSEERNLNEIDSLTSFAHNDVCVINKMQVFNAFYIAVNQQCGSQNSEAGN
jgi:hypothetical protein